MKRGINGTYHHVSRNHQDPTVASKKRIGLCNVAQFTTSDCPAIVTQRKIQQTFRNNRIKITLPPMPWDNA